MREIIEKIEELENVKIDKYCNYDGFSIKTNQNTYILAISNYQNCCESWGYSSSNDNFNEYIGAELLSIEITDDELKTEEVKNDRYSYDIEENVMFLTLHTSNGKLQFAVYNGHNGYYGHSALFTKNGKIIEDDIL